MRVPSAAILLLAATVSPQAKAFQLAPPGTFRSAHDISSSSLRESDQDDNTAVLTEPTPSNAPEKSNGKSMTERMMAKAPQERQ